MPANAAAGVEPSPIGWARRAVEIALVAAPLAGIAYFALLQASVGFAVDRSLPVPLYLVRQQDLPKITFERAAATLSKAGAHDGSAAILAVEAKMRAGVAPGDEVVPLKNALTLAPTSARGWLLLSVALAKVDAKQSGQALENSMSVAPADYWLAGWRAQVAAKLWDNLDADGRSLALRQAALLWQDRYLRHYLQPLLSSDDGIVLMARAFADDRDQIRNMNRWLSAEIRYRSTGR